MVMVEELVKFTISLVTEMKLVSITALLKRILIGAIMMWMLKSYVPLLVSGIQYFIVIFPDPDDLDS